MGAETDIVAGIRSACHGVLELGKSSVLVRTVFGSVSDQNDADFLTILTTESGEIVELAVTVVTECVRELYAPLPFTDDELDVAAEAIVRLVLSALTRPSKPPAEAADDIAWVIELALAGAECAARMRLAQIQRLNHIRSCQASYGTSSYVQIGKKYQKAMTTAVTSAPPASQTP